MKKLLAFLFLLMSGGLYAQDTASFNFTLNHLALSVKDVDRSAGFYKTTLGLKEITNRTQMEGIRWFSLGEGKELHLISTVKENVVVNKAIHLAVTTPQFDAFVSLLQKMKIKYYDWLGVVGKVNVRADGIKQVFLQDPDGYWIEVNSVGK